jgi:hypothetical protein
MNSSDILIFSNRLTKGENPNTVFAEIEMFYVIRQFLNNLNPGQCDHALDEYDSEAGHLLGYLLDRIKLMKFITSDEFADYLIEYFFKQFSRVLNDDLKQFTYFLFQDLRLLHLNRIDNTNFSQILILSEWESTSARSNSSSSLSDSNSDSDPDA